MARPPSTRAPTVLWALFGLDGRVSREVFWLGNFMCGFFTAALTIRIDHMTGVPTLSPLSPFLLVPLIWTEVALAVKRLHDRSLNGWFAVLLAIPLVGIATFVALGLLPGDRGPNRYGPGPNRRGTL
jgi:uncharacterized membrane protein YhaH (DUF805 family)